MLFEYPLNENYHVTFIIDLESWEGPENLDILAFSFIHVEIEAQIVDMIYPGITVAVYG